MEYFSAFNDQHHNEAAFSILFEEDDIYLIFYNKTEEERFSRLCKNFLGLSDRSSPDPSSPPPSDKPSE
jgi:hypothetical protein